MPSIPVVTTSHSSSLRNPCPSGTGIGYMTTNDTIFVICDAAFNNNSVDLGLALGLGLGLGIPFVLFIYFMMRGCNDFKYCYNREKIEKRNSIILPQIFPQEYVKSKLSEEAYTNFIEGNLSDVLKKELIHLRMTEGRDLVECIRYAESIRQADLAHFIAQLNPTELVAHHMV